MNPSRSAVSLALLGLCILLPARTAASGERSWQYEGPPGTVFELAVHGNRVFAAGLLDDVSSGVLRTDWVVQANDARTGRLIWIDRFDDVDQRSDGAFAVAAEDHVVVGAGFSTRIGQGRNWFVRAYNARNGKVLWQDEIHGGQRDQAQAVVIADGVAYVAGVIGVSGAIDPCVAQGFGDCNFVVRAYDAKTGALRWQDSHDVGAGGYDEANGIAVKGNTVFAVGDVAGAFGLPDIHVRAYNARTGALRWADTFDAGLFDAAAQVALLGDLAVVAATGGPFCVLPDPTSDCDAIVRAYDARTGAVRWTVQHDEAGGFDDAFRIVATAGVVVAAGRVTGGDGLSRMAVFAFDRTGDRLWTDVVTLADGESSIARGLAAQGRSVVAVGGGGPGCVGEPISNCDILVRAYGAHSGALRWSDRFDKAGGDDVANAVALQGDTAYVGGSVAPGFGEPPDLAIRAYRDRRR
jgi:outer membrane protein assembly factor BamB